MRVLLARLPWLRGILTNFLYRALLSGLSRITGFVNVPVMPQSTGKIVRSWIWEIPSITKCLESDFVSWILGFGFGDLVKKHARIKRRNNRKGKTVHCQGKGPVGEILAIFFFCVLERDGKSNERRSKKQEKDKYIKNNLYLKNLYLKKQLLKNLYLRNLYLKNLYLKNSFWKTCIWETCIWKTCIWKTCIWKTCFWKTSIWKTCSWKTSVWKTPVSKNLYLRNLYLKNLYLKNRFL